MEYITNNTDYKINSATAVSLGKFDGLHMGHRKLIHNLIKSKKIGYKAVVYTFDMNPFYVVKQKNEQLITTNYERKILLEELNVDYLIECPFTGEIMNMEPEDFIRKIVNELSIKYITVGTDFRFGHDRRGDYKLLMSMSKELGYEIELIDKVMCDKREISSTFIRECIAKGDMPSVTRLLGYPYTIIGEVIHGKQLGRTIGLPTTNIAADDNKLFPPNGVYVSVVTIDNKRYGSVTNIGVKPTVGDRNQKGAETFIFDFDENVYGKEIRVELFKHTRQEMRFETVDELKNQMEKDAEDAKKYLTHLNII